MQKSASYMSLPFDEAIDFFRRKVSLPTETWTDLWQGMHSRAFVVAGAMKSELLSDLWDAVDKAISQGTTLAEFRRDFDKIVSTHGWSYQGGRGWRTSVIYNTNLSVAYSAGRYKEMSDPEVLKLRPLWRYVASSSTRKRIEHVQWYNTILPADDPWWIAHYPPNGWGCKCGVVSHSAREVERLKKEEENGSNPIKTEAPIEGFYEWKNPGTGELIKVPQGIDPGWAYNPGETAWGKKISKETMDTYRAQGGKAWKRLNQGSIESYGRPERIPADPPSAVPMQPVATIDDARAALRKILGGTERVYSLTKGGFRYDTLVNAETLAEHTDLNRSMYFPFIPEALLDPFEVWTAFEQHRGTGEVVLRMRAIKVIKLDKDRSMVIVSQAKNGVMEAWTIIPTSDLAYVNRQRVGNLIWMRNEK